MLAQLEQARLQAAAGSKETGFDYAGADRLYAQAFANYGLELTALDPQEAAERLRASAIGTHLVAALDDWAPIRNKLQRGTGASLRAVADLADDDLWRRRLRRAAETGDRAALEGLAQETTGSQAPGDVVLLARALREAGSGAAAEGLLWRAQREQPTDFWINFELAFTFQVKQRPELAQAVRFYQAALALRPQSPVLYTNLGNALGRQGKLAEAEAACREAIQLDPNVVLAYTNLANALDGQGKPAEAEAVCRRAIELRPNLADAYTNLASALGHQGRMAEAEAACRTAIQFQPNHVLAHHNLGSALSGQGKLADAAAAYRKAIQFEPSNAGLHFNLGLTLTRQGKLPEAEVAYRQAIRLDPGSVQAQYNLGVTLSGQKKLPEAEAAYRQAVRLRPNYAEAYYNLGATLADQGKLPEAEAAYRQAIQFKPEVAEAHCNLGGVLLCQGKISGAVAAYRRGHELGSPRPGWPFPSAKWLASAEEAAALEARHPGIWQGQAKGELSPDDLNVAARTLWNMQRYTVSARLLADALEARPALAERLGYNAACAAAKAASGQGQDASTLSDSGRSHWRNQAVQWLRGDLDLKARQMASAGGKARAELQASLRQWLHEPALAILRDPPALAKLLARERETCQKLWHDVEQLLRGAEGTR
jgi:superkiller protein 3